MAVRNPKGAPQNMRPLEKGSQRARELGALGAKKREENRAKRKQMKDELDMLLTLAVKKGMMADSQEFLSLEELEGKNVSVNTAINIAMVQRAMMGDVQAVQFIRDTLGEKPTDKVEVDQSKTIEAWAKNHKVKL